MPWELLFNKPYMPPIRPSFNGLPAGDTTTDPAPLWTTAAVVDRFSGYAAMDAGAI